ncbi:MAG: peptidylprolyl isomerase [Bacteroidales bacterium]|nr:peptidylprolyl isomerase [Bacteroidales bacterium]
MNIRKLAIVIACIFSTTLMSFAQVLDQIIVVVGDDMIKQSDVENQQLLLEQQGEKSDKCSIFKEMVMQKLLVDQSKIDSVEVSDNEVNSEIDRRIRMISGTKGGLAQLESFYGKSELEIRNDWKPVIKDQLLAQKVQNSIIGEVEVSPNEVRVFYESHKDSMPVLPTRYEYAQIVIRPIVSAEADKALRKKLEEIRERAINGENFSKLAILYSDDTESAKMGGLLGDYLSRGELVPEFAAVAFRLKEGEISRVVKTDFGYHIIQMVELKGEKAKLKHILLKPQISVAEMQKAFSKADSVRKAIGDSLTFEQAAVKYSVDEKTKNNGGLAMNPYTGTPQFQAEMIEPTTWYTLKSMKAGEISEPIMTYDDKGSQVYKILKLVNASQEHKATLIDDYSDVKEMALEQKKVNTLNRWMRNKKSEIFISIKSDEYKNCDLNFADEQ